MNLGNSDTSLHVGVDSTGAVQGAQEVNNALNSMKTTAGATVSAVDLLNKAFLYLGGAAVIRKAVEASIDFSDSLAKINIVSQGTIGHLDLLKESIQKQSLAFATSDNQQAAAMYEIITHGIQSASEATDRLASSNLLAKVTSTDLSTSVAILGQVMDAYKGQITDSAEATDVLFTVIKNGGGSLQEIGASMSMLAPIANQVGVTFKELAAFMAASSQAGLNHKMALMGLRDILGAIANPSAEMVVHARNMGIELSQAALKAKGFQAFMADIAEKTGGNAKNLQSIGLSTMSLVSILIAGGAKGDDFGKMLSAIGMSAGEAQKAMDILVQSPGFKVDQIMHIMNSEIKKFGDTLMTVGIPALSALTNHIDEVERALLLLTGALVAMKLGTWLSAFSAIVLQVAALATPLGVIVTAIAAATAVLYIFGDQIKLTADGTVTLVDVMNNSWKIITSLIGASYATVIETWNNAPEAFASIFIDIINKIREWMSALNATFAASVNGLIDIANKFGTDIQHVVPLLFEPLKNPFARAGSDMADLFSKNFQESLKVNNTQGVWDSILKASVPESTEVGAIENTNPLIRKTSGVSLGTTTGINDVNVAAHDAIKVLADMKREIDNETAAIGLNKDAHDDLITALKIEQDLKDKGQALSAKDQALLASQITKLRELREQASLPQPFYEWQKGLHNIGVTIQQDLVNGFKQASDQLASFVMNGKFNLSSFSDILKNVVQQMISLQIQKNIMAPLMGAANSIFGGLFGSANGNAFINGMPVTALANGGIVNNPTIFPMASGAGLMGEAGPEAVMPLQRMSNGRLGVETSGNGGNVFAPSIVISISGDVSGNSSALAQTIKEQIDVQMANSMRQFSSGKTGAPSQNMKQQIDVINSELMANPNSKTSRTMQSTTTSRHILQGS